MALNLNDLLKKAGEKGISQTASKPASFVKPWQQESVLYNNDKPSEHLIKKESTECEKGFINPVNKPNSSTPFMNPIDESGLSMGFIKEADQRGFEKGVSKPLLKLIDLRGNPLKFINYLYYLTVMNDEVITRRVTLKEIMEKLNISKDSARTALRFLLKNNLIKRVGYQIGKLGWSQYAIHENLLNELKEKGSINPLYEKGFNNSNNNLNITTTNKNELPEEWANINTDPLTHINFTMAHIKQLYKLNITTPETIQESIYHFAWGLEHNPQIKKYDDPLYTLFGTLKKGDAWIESTYESPQKRAMRERLERRRAEQEELKKIEQELEEIEFNEWLAMKLPEEQRAMLPRVHRDRPLEHPICIAELKAVFKRERNIEL